MPVLGWVAEQARGVDRVPVTAPVPLAGDITRLFEIADDALYGALGDPGDIRDLAQPRTRITCDLHQHVAVPGQQRPGSVLFLVSTHGAIIGRGKCHAKYFWYR